MAPAEFEFLINFIGPKIARKDTTYRKAVPVESGPGNYAAVFSYWRFTRDAFAKFRKKESSRVSQKLTAFISSSHLVCSRPCHISGV
jgi:hypothetical protein